MYHYLESGLDYIWLSNGYEEHETDYGSGTSIHDVEGLHCAIGKFVACELPQLGGAEVRFLRIELDMAQTTLAGVLGVSESTLRNWESGRQKISGPGERLLRQIYLEHIDGDGSVTKLIECLSALDRAQVIHELRLEESDTGWSPTAQAA